MEQNISGLDIKSISFTHEIHHIISTAVYDIYTLHVIPSPESFSTLSCKNCIKHLYSVEFNAYHLHMRYIITFPLQYMVQCIYMLFLHLIHFQHHHVKPYQTLIQYKNQILSILVQMYMYNQACRGIFYNPMHPSGF